MKVVSGIQPKAVVVGLCAHGLDVVKALAKRNIEVYAIEANHKLAGVKTKFAKVHIVKDINGPGLIEALRDLQKVFALDDKPVLFLTNDNMVIQVADNWHKLDRIYRLSWADCRNTIRGLVTKSKLQQYCELAELPYPKSWAINSVDEVAKITKKLTFPFIVKPIKPLSKFKVMVVESFDELYKLIKAYQTELPFLIQEWVAGDVTQIMFSAIYFQEGKVLSHFEGRKLGSLPTGLGTTTIAEPITNEMLYTQTLRFFHELNLSGPVSLEFKQDTKGKLWVIEPTLGRTDYWVGCCIANNINFPYIEYCHQSGIPIPRQEQKNIFVWVDIERDPLCFFSLLLKRRWDFKERKRFIFTYLDFADIKPLIKMIFVILKKVEIALRRRLLHIFATGK